MPLWRLNDVLDTTRRKSKGVHKRLLRPLRASIDCLLIALFLPLCLVLPALLALADLASDQGPLCGLAMFTSLYPGPLRHRIGRADR